MNKESDFNLTASGFDQLSDDRLDETAYLEYIAYVEWQESHRDDVDRTWDEKFALIDCECHNNQQNKIEAPF